MTMAKNILLTCTLALALGTQLNMKASADPSTAMAGHVAQAPIPLGAHKPIEVYAVSSNPGRVLSPGYNTIESTTIKCPSFSCTLVLNIMAQIGEASSTGQWAINALVDGASVDGGPLVGDMPGAGKFQVRNWSGIATVGNGRHTIWAQVYVPTQATVHQNSVNYTVAEP